MCAVVRLCGLFLIPLRRSEEPLDELTGWMCGDTRLLVCGLWLSGVVTRLCRLLIPLRRSEEPLDELTGLFCVVARLCGPLIPLLCSEEPLDEMPSRMCGTTRLCGLLIPLRRSEEPLDELTGWTCGDNETACVRVVAEWCFTGSEDVGWCGGAYHHPSAFHLERQQ